MPIGLDAAGILVIDRTDYQGNSTPSSREFISYTGINIHGLTGVSRGIYGSAAQAHPAGSIIESTDIVPEVFETVKIKPSLKDWFTYHPTA